MGTTPGYALPYPEGTDLVIAGDDAIQALAEAVDTAFKRIWATGTRTNVAAVVDGAWTDITYEAFDASAEWFGLTYNGPVRWFMVSFGSDFSGFDIDSVELRLMHGNVNSKASLSANGRDHLGGCIPLLMGPGDTLATLVRVNGSTSAAGYLNSWIRVVSV